MWLTIVEDAMHDGSSMARMSQKNVAYVLMALIRSTVLQIHVSLRPVILKVLFVRVITVEGAMLAGTLMIRISHINVEVHVSRNNIYCLWMYMLLNMVGFFSVLWSVVFRFYGWLFSKHLYTIISCLHMHTANVIVLSFFFNLQPRMHH